MDKKEEKRFPQGTTQGLDDHKASMLTAVEVIKGKRHFFLLTVILTVLGTVLGHSMKVATYRTSSSLFVQNIDQPSAAEYLLNQSAFRLSRVDRIESYVNHLRSDSFYLKIAERLKFHKEFEHLNLKSPRQKSKLSVGFWRNKLFSGHGNEKKENKLLTPIENIVGFIKGSVEYQTDYSSQFIKIHTTTLDPRTSQLIANLIAEEFVGLTNKHSLDELKEIEDFVGIKMNETEEKVKALDKALIAFKQKNNIVSADQTTKSLAERLTGLESEIEVAKIQKEENRKLIAFFQSGQKRALNTLISKGSKTSDLSSTQQLLQSKISQLNRQKSAFLAQGYKTSHFQIRQLDTEIDRTVERLKGTLQSGTIASGDLQTSPYAAQEKISNLQNENLVLSQKIATLRKARANLQGRVDMMPALQQEFIQLSNQFKLEVENLSSLERKEKELEIQRISQKKEVRVDQLATLPGPSPRGSLILKLLFSSFASIFLGVIIIMGLETLDPTIKRRQDLFDCGVEFFGEVPALQQPTRTSRKKMDFGSPEDLVCLNKPDSIESMAFKYMRARIESMRYKQKKDSQVIAVSSAVNDEGKSFITANLAISLSQLQRKTILIDADLRRPSQSAFFGLSSQSGLVDLLNMKKSLDEVLVKDRAPFLDVLPSEFSGRNATELISSQKFRVFLDFLRKEYEYILIDTPPTFAVVDPAIIASYSDIPILVSSFRETRKTDFNMAYNDLLQVSYKKVFGVINKAIVSNSRLHYYGYRSPSDDGSDVLQNIEGSVDHDTQEFIKKLGKSG